MPEPDDDLIRHVTDLPVPEVRRDAKPKRVPRERPPAQPAIDDLPDPHPNERVQ